MQEPNQGLQQSPEADHYGFRPLSLPENNAAQVQEWVYEWNRSEAYDLGEV
jgi:hypothetical protein